MNGPTTLKTCNGCHFLTFYEGKPSCFNPSFHIGGEMETIQFSNGTTLVICPMICDGKL
jgi:hypothetical protein